MQQRAFLKSGRVGITVYGGLIPNNIFEKYYPVGARINYFILENIGVELAGSYAFKSDTNLEPLITESSGVGAQQVLIGDTQVSHTNFGIVWSPFYGKAAFYNTALSYFDIFLFAGVGLVITETTPEFNAEPEQEFKPEGALGAGMSFFMGNHFALRADFRQFVFQKVAGIGGYGHRADIGGLGCGCTLVGRSILQDEALVAISAVDEALLVDLQIDSRMAERRRNLRRAVAGDARGGDIADFGRERIVGHVRALSACAIGRQSPSG